MTERALTVREHAAYLARLGLPPVRKPSATRLRALHRAHLSRVPFENFNRFLGRRISLETGALVHKLVTERRGGICFELNAGFAALLRAEGFEVELLSAQMQLKGQWSPDFDHLTLLVSLGPRRWLTDVGFGVVTREPLQFGKTTRSLRLRQQGRWQVLMARERKAGWESKYRFQLRRHAVAAFLKRKAWHETSEESPFVRHWTCTRAIPAGRVRLLNNHWGVNAANHEISSARQLAQVLRQHFGLVIPVARLKPWKLKGR